MKHCLFFFWRYLKLTRLDLAHEHPRFMALRGLTEDTPPFNLDKSASLSSAGLRGLSAAFLPQEEAAELLTNVPDDSAEPLRHHKETPKTCGDVKMTQKVTTCGRGFVFPCWESGFVFLMQMRRIISLKVAESSATESAEGGDKEAPTSGSSFERTITVVKGNSSLGLCKFLLSFLHFFTLMRLHASS